MKRWNGWGDESGHFPLSESAARYLGGLIGPGCPTPDAPFEKALNSAPISRLPKHPLISTDAEVRTRHACGQSLPDWVALRSGRIPAYPDGVAFPRTDGDVRDLLRFGYDHDVRIIPYGGGTSVVGHINPLQDGPPSLTMDLSWMNRMVDLDEAGRLATFEAGVSGPQLESQLQRRGFTLGHFPQSFEGSTLGGWIATRSSGQQSLYYGRIEDLFAGGHLETPLGELDLPPFPASAAGPDLRQTVLGSEGRLGVLTRAVVRVRPAPERDIYFGVFFHDWHSGCQAVRAVVQAGVPVSMLRLSDALETETTLQLSGKERLMRAAGRGLGLLGYQQERCLLIFGVTGSRAAAASAARQARSILNAHGGLFTGETAGKEWRKNRFQTPYLRNTLWQLGIAADTLETAVPWRLVQPAAKGIKSAIRDAVRYFGNPGAPPRGLVFAHLSHIYPDGASIYVTYLFALGKDPDETVQRWQAMKRAGSLAVIAHGGTISHQHGVGTDHAPYLPAEKGPLGMTLIGAACKCLDPRGLMNPGKLVDW
jgi:alkyldihydroxyacetonephosphate synthase